MPEKKERTGIWLGRRDFLMKLGWGGILSVIGGSLLGVLRYFFPRVLFEPSPIFKAGFPDEYPVNSVSERWKKEFRVWIVRTNDGFYVLSAICTHLGCTPIWLTAENKFKCPCHGSGFRRDGVNYEGPAPRSLERFKITLAEDGQLLVNRSIKFLFEKGDWAKSDSFLSFTA
jgi:cytochrome b6-f complex iron-sulfur subunit